MERMIAGLVSRFERGAINRRQLIQSLAILVGGAGAGAPAEPLAQGATRGLRATGIGHLGVLARDLQRSADFYANAFGLAVIGEDTALKILRLGMPGARGSLVSLRQAEPYGQVDHFALNVEGFNRDAVIDTLKQRGITTQQSPESGFHVTDPDGAHVQIT